MSYTPSLGFKISLVVLIIIAAFILLLQWLSPLIALRFIISIPFLLILPGLFITKIFFPAVDSFERATLTVLLSMVLTYLGIFLAEQYFGKLTLQNTAATVAAVNLLSILFFLAYRQWKTKL